MSTIVVATFFVACVLFEWMRGNYRKGVLSPTDYKMAAISGVVIALIQRPVVMTLVFAVSGLLIAPFQGSLAFLEEQYFAVTLIAFIMIEEYFHGLGHWFCHSKTPKSKLLRPLHKIFRTAHRPHHLIGNDDENAQITVGQTFVEGWLYWLVMPNIWFGFIAVYLGLVEVFMYGIMIKGIWSVHVHVNWQYDLYFLNHKNPVVRKIAYALAHVFTFPTQHHHHHSRGKNSAKNMQNFLALYDWLIWGTLVVENESPKRYGWRQNEKEKNSALYRFTSTYQ